MRFFLLPILFILAVITLSPMGYSAGQDNFPSGASYAGIRENRSCVDSVESTSAGQNRLISKPVDSARESHVDHQFDNGVITTKPTCLNTGIRTFTCTVCGEVRKETVPALGHAWEVTRVTSEVETATNYHGTASFKCTRCGKTKTGNHCAGEIFSDMPKENKWSHKPIEWAYFNGITAGKTENTFAPKAICTRAEVVTFLWNSAGRPEPKTTVNPFSDVKSTAYYYKAVLWAKENGIVAGKTATTFAPKKSCTRAEVVSFLWRSCGSPSASGLPNPFKDVSKSSYYYNAVRWAVKNKITSGKTANVFAPKDNCTRAEFVAFLYNCSRLSSDAAIWSQSFQLYLGETNLKSKALCRGNRVYLDLDLVQTKFSKVKNQTKWPLIVKQGKTYISLADAAFQCRIGVVFRMEDRSIHLYKLGKDPWTTENATGSEKPAYIRLEDIMADYGLNKRFTHDQLVRLRLFGDYLLAKTDGFYIAWIPCYVNPPQKVENNIAENFNFYNTDFVFTLDSMILDGGRIGLHGYTHQDHDSVSASGYEFGANNELTEAEMLERFRKAEKIASELGYTWYFFEFPHYASTAFQRGVAEKHFNVIYQQYPDVEKTGFIETRKIGTHVCRWVPTPGEYVNGLSDRDNFCSKLEKVKNQKKLMSFFFHPYVDTRFVYYNISGSSMTISYDQNGSNVLPEVIRLLTLWGYRLGVF